MTDAVRQPNEKPPRFSLPHDDVTTRFFSGVRGIVQIYHEFADAFVWFSHKALLAWQIEPALKNAERYKNARAPALLRGQDRA
jgi:hypothetical protein